ncbi:hypothetical protein FJZ28_02785 [Candidatus Peregrinibacteria bacterium]|nr:hypothetical protein [Candidatus Peregrinibacteria bacterium]
MLQTFSQLLSSSWNFFRSHFTVFAVAAVVVGLVLFTGQYLLHRNTVFMMESKFGSMERFSDFAERIENGDEQAMDDMMKEMGMMTAEGEINEDAAEMVAKHIIKGLAPALGSFAMIAILLSFLASAYYLVVAVDGTKDPIVALKRACSVVLPLIGLSIWMMLRSFVWIPLIGIIFGFIIGPRLTLAPVLYVRDGMGVFESVRVSNERSRGYWGRIVGYWILAGFTVGIAMLLIFAVFSMLLAPVPMLAGLVLIVTQHLCIAFCSVFYTQFSSDILAHPLAPVAVAGKVNLTKNAPAKKRK